MTVQSSNSKTGPYSGNDSTTVFPYTFQIAAEAELEVVKTGVNGVETILTLTADYTVTGVDNPLGGTVVYPVSGSPLAGGAVPEKLTIRRSMDFLQNTDLTNQGAFLPDVVEAMNDKNTKESQQLLEEQSRAITIPLSDNQTAELPTAANRTGGKFVGADAVTGQILMLAGTSTADAAASIYLPPFDDTEAVTVNKVLAEWPSASNWGALLDGSIDDSIKIQNGIDYMSANGGGEIHFPFGARPKFNVILKSGVYLVGPNGPASSRSGSLPVEITAAVSGSIIGSPVTTTNSCGVRGLGFRGLGAGTAAQGIFFEDADRVVVQDCSFDNFSDSGLKVDSDCGAGTFIDNFGQNCLLNRTQAAKVGAFDLDGADHHVERGEWTASVSALSDSNARIGAVVIRGGEHFVNGLIGEISDFGIAVIGVTSGIKFSDCRADLNYGNGWEVNGTIYASNCIGLRNSRETTNTYDNWLITAGNGAYSNCQAVSLSVDAWKARYGFNDTQSSDSNKNFYDSGSRSFQHATAAFNFASAGGAHQTPTGPEKTLTDGDTTPDVENYGTFLANNTGATSITDFDNPFRGQIISIRTSNTNTTFVHNNSVLRTNTTANRVSVANGIYSFVNLAGVWHEMGGY